MGGVGFDGLVCLTSVEAAANPGAVSAGKTESNAGPAKKRQDAGKTESNAGKTESNAGQGGTHETLKGLKRPLSSL